MLVSEAIAARAGRKKLRARSYKLIAGFYKRADVAQLVEHSLGKGEVTSSILVISSRNARDQGSGISEGIGGYAESPRIARTS